ncbi:MAG: host attachment protein [Parvularculaceae bacterium]
MQKKTWILIADASRARVFESIGPREDLVEVNGYAFSKSLPMNRDLVSDRPARSYESVGDARHAITRSGEDPRRRLKRDFANEIAEQLHAAIAARSFQRLVVVAPAAMLGDLRSAFSAAVSAAIVAELVRDLTKVPVTDLRSHFGELVGI